MEKSKLLFLQSLGLCKWSGCSSEENKMYTEMQKNNEPLPDGIILDVNRESTGGTDGNIYARFSLKEYNDKDVYRLIESQKLQKLNTIKNCVVFFTIMAAIGIGAGLIMMLQLLG